jgi:phospholipid transport system substrate-binding protein
MQPGSGDTRVNMTTSLDRRSLLAAIISLSFAPTAFAKTDPKAEAYVNSITNEVISLANSGNKGKRLKAQFSSLLSRYVNIRKIANYALGTYQKQLPAGDRDMFYDLVANYAAALFVYYVDDFKGNGLEVKGAQQQGSFVTVDSAITLNGKGIENVRWRLSPSDGGFRVADVNLKGVWMTISMRKRFNDVLNKSKGNFKPLYEELREAETW